MSAEALSRDAERLAGCVLTAIHIGPYHVDLQFLGELDITLRLKAPFRFTLHEAKEMSFDPTDEHPHASGTAFVALRGQRCSAIDLGLDHLSVRFESGGSLSLDLQPLDFEPFELIGRSTGPSSSLAFYHVA